MIAKKTTSGSNPERTLINARIKQLGYRKEYLAAKIGLTPSEFSHLTRGIRQSYNKEKKLLFKILNIKTTAPKK